MKTWNAMLAKVSSRNSENNSLTKGNIVFDENPYTVKTRIRQKPQQIEFDDDNDKADEYIKSEREQWKNLQHLMLDEGNNKK